MPSRNHTRIAGMALSLLTLLGATAQMARAQTPAGPVGVDPNLAKTGKRLFTDKGCQACHIMGKKSAGPDLVGVLERRDPDWVRRWLKTPEAMYETDSTAKALLQEFNNTKMPNMKLKDNEIEAFLHYFADETAKRRGGAGK